MTGRCPRNAALTLTERASDAADICLDLLVREVPAGRPRRCLSNRRVKIRAADSLSLVVGIYDVKGMVFALRCSAPFHITLST